MDSLFYFVIPVRHHKTIRDWSIVQRNLEQTLASISAQTNPNWECRIVASHGSVLPGLPAKCTAKFINLPAPVLPEQAIDRDPYYDAIRADKGLRIYEGIRDIPSDAFVMPVDYDDFVSNRLVEFASKNRRNSGWYFPYGYIHSGGGWGYRANLFHRRCGTSHIIKRRALGDFASPDGELDMDAIKRRLGSHIFNYHDLARTPDALEPLPFCGSVYRIGNPQSASGTKDSIFRTMTPPEGFLRDPLRTIYRLHRYRPMTAKIRKEFSLP